MEASSAELVDATVSVGARTPNRDATAGSAEEAGPPSCNT